METVFRLIIFLSLFIGPAANCQSKMVSIKGGEYIPLYGRDNLPVAISDFSMDVYPVTNDEFLQFVIKNPKWRKSMVKKIFAEKNYLANWTSDVALNAAQSLRAPVTNVSWFVANEYCKCMGKRLPTVDEWEYVAMANEKLPDARKLKKYNEFILGWYEKPKTFSNEIGSTFKNYWGVYDLHGLVWEWTSDFNSVLITGESRKDSDKDSDLFCGSDALNANDLMNYAAFMRYAFRGSVKANYAIKNLGFRCVKDKK